MNHGHLWITKATSTLVLLALDADTREIVGVAIGARNETAAGQLWNSLAPVYRQRAIRAPRVMPPAYRATPIFGSIRSSPTEQAPSSGRERGRGKLVTSKRTRGANSVLPREMSINSITRSDNEYLD